MVFICCVPSCNSNEKTHSFPKTERICQKWIEATKLFHLNKETAWHTHHQVCRKHFKEDDYTSNRLKYLKKGVVPSLNLPVLNPVTEHSYCNPDSVQISQTFCESFHTDEKLVLALDKANVYMTDIEMNELQEISESTQGEVTAMEINDTFVVHDQVTLEDDNDQMTDDSFKFIYKEDSKGNLHSPQLPPPPEPPKTNKNSTRPYDPIARKLKYQSTRITFLKRRIREIENPKDSTLNKYLASKLTPEQNSFVQMMLRNAGKKKKGWRFTKDNKHFAIAAYKQSPKAYRHYQSFFGGPSRTTIYKHAAFVRFEAGINPKLFELIKSSVNNLSENEKYVTIGWDEMSLLSHLDYNFVKDYIDGFVDYGDRREMKFGTHALVFMVRGIVKEFKQPVAYFITENISSTELTELIQLVIKAVQDTGLSIVGSVCDAVQTNRSAVNKLRTKLVKNSVIEYVIRGAKIIHIYDPPHLLKSLRNNLLVKNLNHVVAIENFQNLTQGIEYDKEDLTKRVASWTDVKDFYGHALKSSQSLLPKIRDEHIKPVKLKMKVSVAAQVFSRTFGREMQICSDKKQLFRDLSGTANILHFFNDVFDSLNGGGVPINNRLMGSINESSDHFVFWEYATDMIKKMHFADLNGRKDVSKVLSDFIVTIKGLSELTKAMLKVTDTVSIRRMTQDALENFFGGIRSVIYSPTVCQFRGAYGTSMVNILSLKHSIYSNCEADGGSPLLKNLNLLESLSKHDDSIGDISVQTNNREVNEQEHDNLSFNTIEGLDYTAGGVCRKLLKNLKCSHCRDCIEIDNGYPSESFLKCFTTQMISIKEELPAICIERKLKERFIEGITRESDIGCEEHKKQMTSKLVNITFEHLVMNLTKNVNRLLRGLISDVEPENKIEENAKEFYKKKKNIGRYNPKIDMRVSGATEESTIPKSESDKNVDAKLLRKVNNANSCDKKEKKSVIKKCANKKSVTANDMKENLILKPNNSKLCVKKQVNKKTVIKKPDENKPAIEQNVNKNISIHKMQLRNKKSFNHNDINAVKNIKLKQ